MKTFITGASGFIGKALARRFLNEGFEVICTSRSLKKLDTIPKDAKKLLLDISNEENLVSILKEHNPDVVFHCAAETNSASWEKLKTSNITGTKNLLAACAEAKIKKVVYLSSISVIAGNKDVVLTDNLPYSANNAYGMSKIDAEKIAKYYREQGLKIAILRPTMVYGEDDPHSISLLVELIRWKLFPIVGTGKNRFPLLYIENLLDVMLISIKEEKSLNGTFIVADKEIITYEQLFLNIAKLWGLKPPARIPAFFIPLLKALPFIGKKFKIFFRDKVCDISRLNTLLNYMPRISFDEGMKRVIDNHKKN